MLIHKLRKLVFSCKLFLLISDYLKDRSQRVVLDGVSSEFVPVTPGAPQGSILGPLLFLLSINDKPHCAEHSILSLFADDSKKQKMFLPHPRVKVSIVGSLRDREVACSASDRQGSNFESCVWRTVSSQSSHHPQEVLLAQFSLYVHKGGLKPDSFHFADDAKCFRKIIM